MSVWGRRGSYSATAFVAVLFVVLASIAHLLRPYIDQQENEELATSASDLMRVAKYQKVQWKAWSPETVALARRRDRPILVYAGTVWGELRPKFDSITETDEIAELMNREFVCVRADGLMQTKWRTGPLQLARNERNDSANFAIYIFSPEGGLIAAPSSIELSRMNDSAFLVFLRSALNQYTSPDPTNLHELAVKEAFQLTGGLSSQPGSPQEYGQRLNVLFDREHGGFKGSRESELMPYEYDLLLDLGQEQVVQESINLLLTRPIRDALWGGFFERWWVTDTRPIVYAKSGFSNAGMLTVLSRLSMNGDIQAKQDARRQFSYVLNRFAHEKATAYDFAEWKDARRSPKHSFSPRRLRALLTEQELHQAENDLGLDVKTNPQAIPYFANRLALSENPATYDPILAKLKAAVINPQDYEGHLVSYEVQAHAIAALCRSARILNDPDLKAQAIMAFIGLKERMRSGIDDIKGWPGTQSGDPAGVSCYLAYCAAAWEAMLMMGDEQYGTDGLKVLNRAIFLFCDPQGALSPGRFDDLEPEWKKLFGPEVLDLLGPSAVSELVRLGALYTAWRGSDPQTSKVRNAVGISIRQSGWVIDQVPIKAGSLAKALHLAENGTAIGVPRNGDWPTLESQFPGQMLVPHYQADQLYRIRRNGVWSKPMTLPELQGNL